MSCNCKQLVVQVSAGDVPGVQRNICRVFRAAFAFPCGLELCF